MLTERPNLFPLNTATDHAFDLVNAPHHQVDIMDIAWGLSQINRYYGSAYRPYSVAEHSLLVWQIAGWELGLDAHGQLAALMHDAHEIYCSDLHPTTKRLLGPAWTTLEAQYETAVRSAFGLHTAFGVHAEAIHQADQMALAIELRDIKGGSLADWGKRHGVRCAEDFNLDDPWRDAATWQYWRDDFLGAFHRLENERAALLSHAFKQPSSTPALNP
jgi:uncharacterized protein